MTEYYNLGEAKKQAKKIFLAAKADNFEYISDPVKVEWAQIAPDRIVVATKDRTWLSRPRSGKASFTKPMKCDGSIATTRKLLDGAIAAAKYTVDSNVRPPALTATRWVWRLAGQYHLCHVYPSLIEEAARQFEKAGRSVLAQWAAEKIIEERGHDLLALRDIQSLGYDAKAVKKALFPPAAAILINYLSRSVQDSDPIDSVGYSYAMERLAQGVDEQYIQKVEALLPTDTQATRCLRVHSSIGADAEHVEETVKMVAGLTAKERTRVAIACYETALMCFSSPSKGYISDEELQQILRPLEATNMSVGDN